MKIKILYEDKDVLAIDKPSGVAVHPAPEQVRYGASPDKKKEEFITDWVLKNYPKLKGIGEPVTFDGKEIDRPGIVHRLDKETSGVLVLVKNEKAFQYFKKQFMDRKIKKIYHCLVSGFVKNDKGVINKPIGRSPSDFRRRLAGRGARGELREAITEYKVINRFFDKKGNKFSYLEVYPKTGRTHQIRVHMKYFSHPVVHDSLYNPNTPSPSGIDRLALHAHSIEFNLPAQAGNPKGEVLKIESPLPKEFKTFLRGII